MYEYTSGVARISDLERDIQQKFTQQRPLKIYIKFAQNIIKFSKIFQE